MKIFLCCGGGMSSSVLVSRIQKLATEMDDIDIVAISIGELEKLGREADVVALAPQIQFQKSLVAKYTDAPVYLIETRDYGMMNAEKVLKEIIKCVKKY